jgi:excisionase family DNA binding protein
VTETKVRPLTIKESAKYAHVHEKTMLRAVQRGECRGYQRAVNVPWRIYQDDLDCWIRGEQPTKRRKAA